MSEIPYTYDRTHTAASLHEEFDDKIETGSHTEIRVSVAGRIMLRRGQGKLAFATLDDATARIQLFAPVGTTQNFQGFTELNLGDWVGIKGTMMKTRKGELSIQVDEWVMLAEAKRPFPDKWHGLTDTDTRYRQRYVDLWVTEESRRTLMARSRITSIARRFLEDEGFTEVETPILQTQPGGALAVPFSTHHNVLDMPMYLRIAPELYLKRLVVGGLDKVFELGRVFRNEGMSQRHNPEFTMLEWYEAYADGSVMMNRCERMVEQIAIAIHGSTKFQYQGREVDVKTPWPRKSMSEITGETIGATIDIADPESVRKLAQKYLDKIEPHWGPGKMIVELYEKTTEPTLWGPLFVTEHPKEVSPLSRDHRSKPGLTERFEATVGGREVADGWSELVDPDEQRSVFEGQAALRQAGDEEAMRVDEDFLRALEHGMPPSGGIGVGIDRLTQLLTDNPNIRDVLLFPTLRPEQT